MKTLKLEVGKTYLSRNGKEVKIVEKGRSGKFPYKSNDGRRYAENGRFTYYAGETPYDLVEEIPSETTRHTFDIPEGVKKVTVEQVGNRIVVEMVPEKGPKPGDVMINDRGSVYIFKAFVDDDTHEYYAWLGKSGSLSFGRLCLPGHPATPEEAQRLWDALKKAGKRWNVETMEVEEIPESTRIREWVEENLKDGYYNQQGIAEVVGHYLKHKEDEK